MFDAVHPKGANGIGPMGQAEQIPTSVAHDDRPRVHHVLPAGIGCASIGNAHPTAGGDGADQVNRYRRIRSGDEPVGHGHGVFPHGGRRPRHTLRAAP